MKFLDANPVIRGINGTGLVELVLQYCEKPVDKHQKAIPLKKVTFRHKAAALPLFREG